MAVPDLFPRKRKAAAMTEEGGVSGDDESSNNHFTTPLPTSRLLRLPAELRNMIYRLVLVDPEPIAIRDAATLPQEPALLRASTQMRREAGAVYYQENHFKVYIVDFDAGLYRRWYGSSLSRRGARKEYVVRDSTNWPNLLAWLKAYYYGESSKPGAKRSGRPCINASLFSLVQRMKRQQRLSWTEVEANLEDVHQSLVATDPRWL